MKIRIDVSEKIPKYLHDEIYKKCLREFCDYKLPIEGIVVGYDRIIESIQCEFSMHFNKRNILIIYVSTRGE